MLFVKNRIYKKKAVIFKFKNDKCCDVRMGEPFTSDFKITTREPSFVLQNAAGAGGPGTGNPDPEDPKLMKAHSSSNTLCTYPHIFTTITTTPSNYIFCL